MHYFVHHLNDLSGSPKILGDKIRKYKSSGEEVFLVTNQSEGFLSGLDVSLVKLSYSKSSYKFITLLYLLWFHLRVGLFLYKNVKEGDFVHVNTLVNSPLVILKLFCRCQFLIHIMEVSLKPKIYLNLMLFFAARFDGIVCLSQFVVLRLNLSQRRYVVTYPYLGDEILMKGDVARSSSSISGIDPKNILMISSMVWFKGYKKFIELAACLPQFKFTLVLNGSQTAFDDAQLQIPKNVTVMFNVKNVTDVYAGADLVVSLTDRKGWVETYALTLAEALAFGIPVISPNIGAQLEYLREGFNSILLRDERSTPEVVLAVNKLVSDYDTYKAGACESGAQFTFQRYSLNVDDEISFIQSL